MALSLVFILFLILDNLILPALIGTQEFLVTPTLLIAILFYHSKPRTGLIVTLIFALVAEIFSGFGIGSFIIPFGITALLYIWLNRFLAINYGLKEEMTFFGIIKSSLIITSFVYVYSWFFIFLDSSYSFALTWDQWKILVLNSLTQTLGWSIGLSIFFKYVFKIK